MNDNPTTPEPKPPLTAGQVQLALRELFKRHPDAKQWPVHILDMDTRDDDPEYPWDGLVTMVTLDCFDVEQGNVVSLVAWRSQDGWKP